MATHALTNERDLLQEIRSRRDEIEQGRRMPLDLVERLGKAGVFGLGAPRAIGGAEATPTDIMRAIETVATADGSAGWCAMIGLSSNIAGGYMNEPGAKEVFADPNAPNAATPAPSGKAVPIDGGFRVSGRWPFGSGITHSRWVWAGCLVMDGDQPLMTPNGPAIVHPFLPVADVEVHDTWYVSGLRGTGSNDFSATDVEVPEHRVFSLFDPSGHRSEPLYQMPVVGMFVLQVASVSLGIARAAVEELVGMAPSKTPAMSSVVLADKPVAQIEVARMEAALQAARSFLYDAVEQMWSTVSDGNPYTMKQEALLRAAGINTVETAARITASLNTLGGSNSIYSSSSLQRHARDAEAITHHFTVAPHAWEEVGRVLMGRDPTVPVF
jgi:indole-3-acetate monooxygenase